MAVGPWLMAAAALAPKVIDLFAGDDKDDEARKRIEQERELFGRRQQLDRDERGWEITKGAGELMSSSAGYDPNNVPFDLGFGTVRQAAGLEGDNRLFDANQGLQRDAQELDWQRQLEAAEDQEAQESGWQSWISPLLSAGGAMFMPGGPFAGKGASEALQAKRDRLNTLQDDVDFANANSDRLGEGGLRTALEEAEERQRATFLGPRRRMNIHEF